MQSKFSYTIALSKEETKTLRNKHSPEIELNYLLWEGSKSIKTHHVRAITESCVNTDYLILKVIANTFEGLGLGVKFLNDFVQKGLE